MNGFLHKPGDTPLEGYTVEKPLGHGGFGEVYHARSAAGKDVALKLIQRFLEIELRGVGHCLNLKHPHLVTIYDVRPDSEGRQWIVMEYVAGESLSDAIAKHPDGMPAAEALRWFEPICQAVEHLHQSGIVHRDLKPGNIFDDRGTIKVGDYGLAKFITASKRSAQTQSVGTLHYMAPEVGSGRYGREVDVYAVGVILYEMLTGKVPFEGESAAEILMKHLTSPPDLEALPVAFRGVVARMLAKNPNDRYGSLASVLSDLKVKLADAAHAEAIGEPSQYPAYEAAVVSRPGVSEWLEAPFDFLKNLAGEHGSDPPAAPRPSSDSQYSPEGGAGAWMADALRVQPLGFALSVFLTLAAPLLAILALNEVRPRPDLVGACLLCTAGAVAAWGYLARAVAQARDDVNGGGSEARRRHGPARPGSDRPDQAWLHEPQRSGADAQPVHAGATEFWDSPAEEAYNTPRPGPMPRERREAIGHELDTFRRWTYSLGSLFMALCLGLGAGLLAAGAAIMLVSGRHGEDIAPFFGVGAGFFCAGLILSRRLAAIRRPMRLRLLVPLFLGGGVGLTAAGLTHSMIGWGGPEEEAAVLLAVGCGFTTAAAIAWGMRLSIGRSAVIRFFNAIFWGGGVGGLCAAAADAMFDLDGPREHLQAFFGAGPGFLVAGLFLCRLIAVSDSFIGLRVLASLFIGGGVGLLAAGLSIVMTRHEEPAAFLGAGTGFLTCGIVAWHLFTTNFAHRARPRW